MSQYRASLLPKYRNKRTFDTFSEASAGQTDWLLPPSLKLDVVKTVFQDNSKKIFIPGIGHSTLGIDLQNEGYKNITVADLNREQVSEKNRELLKPVYFDLLEKVPDELMNTFDYVIDSSVTDVFMQLTSGTNPSVATAKQVHDALLSTLNEDGVMIIFSMNNKPWDRIYGKEYHRQHLRIRPTLDLVSKRGRSIKKQGEDVLVMVASKIKNALMQDVMTDDEDAKITEWSASRPEDWEWQSQRS